MDEPLSDKDTEAVANLDGQLAQRTLIIRINDQDGTLEVDDEGLAAWELAGIASQLAWIADEQMCGDDDEE